MEEPFIMDICRPKHLKNADKPNVKQNFYIFFTRKYGVFGGSCYIYAIVMLYYGVLWCSYRNQAIKNNSLFWDRPRPRQLKQIRRRIITFYFGRMLMRLAIRNKFGGTTKWRFLLMKGRVLDFIKHYVG